jgi:hypothetical protein
MSPPEPARHLDFDFSPPNPLHVPKQVSVLSDLLGEDNDSGIAQVPLGRLHRSALRERAA